MHCIGVSSQAAAHRTLVPELVRLLRANGMGDTVVIAGGVIPPEDYQALYDAGVTAVFGPGTKIPDAAMQVLKAIDERLTQVEEKNKK